MIRILHISRWYDIVPSERRIMAMAEDPGIVFRLVRPPRRPGPLDAHPIRDHARLEHVRLVRTHGAPDPHRGWYQTLTFGMRAARPDIIHAEEEPDSIAALQVAAARRLLAPDARLVLATWQNVNRKKAPHVEWVLSRALQSADAVICANREAVTVLRQFGYRKPAPVIPPLVLDSAVFHRVPAPRLDPAFTIGFVGRLVPEKGVDTLIRAVASLEGGPALAVVGSGPSRSSLEAMAREAGIGERVRFLGALAEHEIVNFLCAVDVIVVPSRPSAVWKEQFCRVAVEAMGCEVPLVAAESGALPEVVGDGGLLFPEDDHVVLADHLRRLMASPEYRAELGRRGLQRALSAHSPGRRAAETTQFYRELLRERDTAVR